MSVLKKHDVIVILGCHDSSTRTTLHWPYLGQTVILEASVTSRFVLRLYIYIIQSTVRSKVPVRITGLEAKWCLGNFTANALKNF